MKKTKLLTLFILPALLCGLPSCNKETGKYKIGICQLVTHDALDAATNGFMDAVKEGLGEANVEFDLQNASGDSANCNVIANSFVSKNVNLIMANATPALQACSNATPNIPVLGTSVTEYGSALSIPDFDGTTGFNVSGTSDLAPLDEQAKMIKTILPDVQKVGLLYCSAESNSLYQVQVVEQELEKIGIQSERMSFTDSNDISAVINSKINSVGAIYIPTDNTAASNVKTIKNICEPKKMPIFAGEEGICKEYGVATLTISYYNIGRKTGEMAVEILKNNADITKMKIENDPNPVKKYNKEVCEELGITVPSDYIEL